MEQSYTAGGVTIEKNSSLNYDANGTSTEKYVWIFDKKILLPPGKYFISAKWTLITRVVVVDRDNNRKTFYNNSSVTVPENVKEIQLLIGTPEAGTIVNEKNISVMLNAGEVALAWKPYVEGSVMTL